MDDLTKIAWDDIVIGTGMGGATCGYALAKAGRKVLFLEKGLDYIRNPLALKSDFLETFLHHSASDESELYRNAGRSKVEIIDVLKKRTVQPILGSGTGGSTALYGMVMDRFWPQDFEPRRYHPKADPDCTLPDRWPISYSEIEPYYRKAESLYRVSCSLTDPLRKDEKYNYYPAPLSNNKKDLRFQKKLLKKGMHLYNNPLALDWVEDCRFCQSYLCDKDCKNDSAKICLRPAQKDFGAALLADCEATRLEADNKKVTRLIARYKNRELSFSASNIILAGGALFSPILLMESASEIWPEGLANHSGLVGRNLMRHYIDILAIFSRSPFPKNSNLKEHMINDFYIVNGEKFGTLGAFGHFPPAFMAVDSIEKDLKEQNSPFLPVFRSTKGFTQSFLSVFFSMAGYLALILEDLPYPDNRLVSRKNDKGDLQIAVEYHMRPSELQRIRRFREMSKKVFWPNPCLMLEQADNLKFLAHACGTCRFGDDPQKSVLNKYNRSHDLMNLYVVDASFFPSSGGLNPGLTIAANALRVADHIIENRSFT